MFINYSTVLKINSLQNVPPSIYVFYCGYRIIIVRIISKLSKEKYSAKLGTFNCVCIPLHLTVKEDFEYEWTAIFLYKFENKLNSIICRITTIRKILALHDAARSEFLMHKNQEIHDNFLAFTHASAITTASASICIFNYQIFDFQGAEFHNLRNNSNRFEYIWRHWTRLNFHKI